MWSCNECSKVYSRDEGFALFLKDRGDKYHKNACALCNACYLKNEKKRKGLWTCSGSCEYKQQRIEIFF